MPKQAIIILLLIILAPVRLSAQAPTKEKSNEAIAVQEAAELKSEVSPVDLLKSESGRTEIAIDRSGLFVGEPIRYEELVGSSEPPKAKSGEVSRVVVQVGYLKKNKDVNYQPIYATFLVPDDKIGEKSKDEEFIKLIEAREGQWMNSLKLTGGEELMLCPGEKYCVKTCEINGIERCCKYKCQ